MSIDLSGLVLTKLPPGAQPVSTFIASLKFMHGDADLYTEGKIRMKSRDDLNDFYAVVDKYFSWGWNERIERMGKNAELRQMPEFWLFTGAESKEEYETDEHPEWWDDFWPMDAVYDSGYRTMLDTWWVNFYDDDGVKYLVEREGEE